MSKGPASSGRSPLSKRQLQRAARHVRQDRRAAGLDGVLPVTLYGKAGGKLVTQLHQMFKAGRWRPFPARTGLLPRPGKKPRKHAIASVRDAVALRAAVAGLEHIWERLPACIVGGRPDGNCHDIISAVTRFLMKGGGHGFRCDVKGAFENASFDKAISKLRTLTHRQDLVDIIVRWRRRQGKRFKGLVEGAPYAPLLLAVLLAEVAEKIEKLGQLFIWLDDGLFLTKDPAVAAEAERLFREHLETVGDPKLELHPDKSVSCAFEPNTNTPSKIHFLGFRWRGWLTEPLPDGVEEIFSRLHDLAGDESRRGTLSDVWAGWVAAVARPDSRLEVLAEIDERLRVEIDEKYPAWGPFESLVAHAKASGRVITSKRVVLREPKRSRTRWLQTPGTSGSGMSRRWKTLQEGTVPGAPSSDASSPPASSTASDISKPSSTAGAPEAGMGLASGASSIPEAE